jgi:hypothetical protein
MRFTRDHLLLYNLIKELDLPKKPYVVVTNIVHH